MILGLEMFGAFLAGVVVTVVTVVVGGKWYLRRKFGGMVDLIGVAYTKRKPPDQHVFYSTAPPE